MLVTVTLMFKRFFGRLRWAVLFALALCLGFGLAIAPKAQFFAIAPDSLAHASVHKGPTHIDREWIAASPGRSVPNVLDQLEPESQTNSGWFGRLFRNWLPWSVALPLFLLWQGAASILRQRCPKCYQFSLKRTITTLQEATHITPGRQRVDSQCTSCDYTATEVQRTPSFSEYGGDGGGGQ